MPLSHCGAALSLGRGHARRRLHTHLETCTRTNRSPYNFSTIFHPTYPWPSHKHTQRGSHSTLRKIVTHTSFLTTHTSLSHNPCPPSDLETQSVSPFVICYFFSLAFLPGFMDQRREQLHQRRSGGVEMKRCVAVGKHLAAVRRAEQEG